MKNKVEIHGDIALIHIKSYGVEHIAIVDIEDLRLLNEYFPNKLTLDSNGAVQHKQMKDGKWKVHQIHREIFGAFAWERVGFKNGNKLDLRLSNLQSDYSKGKAV